MGFSYGILSGLTKDVTGAQQGEANRKKLEQQAMHQMLADSLMSAQVEDTKAQTQQRLRPPKLPKSYTSHFDPKSGKLISFDTETGKSTTEQVAPPEAPTKAGDWSLGQILGPDGQPQSVRINKIDGRVVPYGKPVPKAGKAPTVVDRETKAAARTALDLIGKMQKSAKADMENSQLPVATSVLRGVGRLPMVGESLKGLTEPGAQQFMTPKQAGYQQQADQLLHLASSVLPKGGRSVALLQNLRSSFTSAAGAKNPQAAQDALEELKKQITEVLGENSPAAGAPATDATSPARKASYADLAKKYNLGGS